MKRKVANLLSGSGLALAIAAVVTARRWPAAAATFPTLVASLVGGLAMINLWLINFGRHRGDRAEPTLDLQLAPSRPGEFRDVAFIFLWLAGFLLGIYLLGFPAAALLFVLLYLRLDGKESWPVALAGATLTGAIVYLFFVLLLKTSYQTGWLLEWLRHN